MPDFYGTPEGYTAYHLARNHDIQVLDETEILAALLVASEWLDARYRLKFGGEKMGGREQVREWERRAAYDIYDKLLEGIPREIEYATYEAAAIQGATPGALSLNFTPGKYESVSIDGAVSVVYATIQSVSDVQTQFAIIGEILSPILTGFGGSSVTGSSCR
ncbi:hypothetical protein HUU40_00140 [candidate division KSB1 bacterium]|nr:hypothetical protein [candidate division KSB1 bacterium]